VQNAADGAAEAEARLKRRTTERAIFHWAIASTVALAIPVLLGVFFLRSVWNGSVQSEPILWTWCSLPLRSARGPSRCTTRSTAYKQRRRKHRARRGAAVADEGAGRS
jgi:hypothetical protein